MWLGGWVLRILRAESSLWEAVPSFSYHVSFGKFSNFSMLHFSLRKLWLSYFLSIYMIVLINLYCAH